MGKEFAIYVGHNCQRQQEFTRELSTLGMELHREVTIDAVSARLSERFYSLFLIQHEDVYIQIFDFFSLLRSKHPDSVVMVLADNLQNINEKQLFDSGVDDVVIGSSTDPLILTSRIKKRLFSSKVPWTQTKKIMLKGGTLVDFACKKVQRSGCIRILSSLEDKLLRYFLNNPYRIITRDEMLESEIWDMSVARAGKKEGGKAFDIAISRLRRIIEVDPRNPQIITTAYGKGWMLTKGAVL